MSKKAWGIGDLTETEQQPGYCPERLDAQLAGEFPPIKKVDERGFEYVVYPKDLSHPRWKNSKPKEKKKHIAADLQEEIPEIDLELE